MFSILTLVSKRIEELDIETVSCSNLFCPFNPSIPVFFCVVLVNRVFPLFCFPCCRYNIKNLNFIVGSFYIMRGTFLEFESYLGIVDFIFGKPYSGKMSPSKFLNDNISIQKDLTNNKENCLPNVNWMIASNFVILNSFIFTCVTQTIADKIYNYSYKLEPS
jgi:hypothetical protein